MKVERLNPVIGARVSDIDLAGFTRDDRDDLRALLEEHLVLFFTGQSLDPHTYKRFGEAIGELEVTPMLPGLGGDLDEIHFVEVPAEAQRGFYSDAWHSDVPFRECPPYASILRPEVLPPLGGDTMWASMYAAYERLAPPLRRLADELEVVQAVSSPRGSFEYTHPAVRVHPGTGRRGLYINSVFSKRIVGASVVESARLIDMFSMLAVIPDVQLRYRWTLDTVAIWDNRFTQHYAAYDYSEHRRMQRMTVIGEPVVSIADWEKKGAVAAAAA